VSNLTSRGLSTVYVSGDWSDKTVKDDVFKGRYQLVLISPELLMTNLYWREMMRTDVYQKHLVAFVVDEAHCIIKW
jgi:superfamily II DNA helicase RecQ